ncbi:MAG: imidazole glycerol phosphate synthase subunit HisH [Myxococcota bacterium]
MTTSKVVTVVDYGLGNLFSVERALAAVGAQARFAQRAEDLLAADRVILPGVGAFADGMRGLTERGLLAPIQEVVARGTPLLGICLGMQLLMTEGHEFGHHQGLGVLPGAVVPIPPPDANGGYKVPNMGWGRLLPAASDTSWQGTVLADVKRGEHVYFVHGFVVQPSVEQHAVAMAECGPHRFCASVRRENVHGTQFHPEKSGPAGQAILSAFLKM